VREWLLAGWVVSREEGRAGRWLRDEADGTLSLVGRESDGFSRQAPDIFSPWRSGLGPPAPSPGPLPSLRQAIKPAGRPDSETYSSSANLSFQSSNKDVYRRRCSWTWRLRCVSLGASPGPRLARATPSLFGDADPRLLSSSSPQAVEVPAPVVAVVTPVAAVAPAVVAARTRTRSGASLPPPPFAGVPAGADCPGLPPSRVPVTKLGRLVKDGKIKSMEEIYLFSLPVKEFQIVDFFLPTIKDEVMCIAPVQKQTSAGQRTRFKACVAVGDFDGHVGLGVKCSKEVAGAIRGAIIAAKLAIIPVRRGYWGSHIAEPHTIPMKVSGKCGSVMCRLIPAPRGTGIVAAPASKRLLQMAGVQDCYTQSKGSTATTSNFMKATFVALAKSYQILTPDLWREIAPGQTPYDQVRPPPANAP
jgi:small subunit ribosomal protein S2e